MLTLQRGSPSRTCQGPSRRTAIKAGFLGVAGLGLGDFFRLRAQGAAAPTKTSCILLWLDGGPSHFESYDPKPEAPAEYRGPFQAINTNVPGIRVCETLPEHAKRADRMALLRSVHHDTGDHFAGAHAMLTGRFGATGVNTQQRYPGVGAYVSRVRGTNAPGLPAYVGLPSAESVYIFPGYHGASYLGGQYNPFDVDREKKYLSALDTRRVGRPKCLDAAGMTSQSVMTKRRDLLGAFDTLRRDIDRSGTADTLDRYQQQALDLVAGTAAREAFDIDKEDPRQADRYGQGPWGRYTLMARRLVEAGVTFVTVDMPHWDDHSRIQEMHPKKLTPVDRAVGALIDDLVDRGLYELTLVVVMGEFGRTPKINNGQPGIPVPGRDHWGNVFSVMLAGGGLKGGVVVGASNARGEVPADRPLTPSDVLATIYHVLGIDPTQTFLDHTGRPVPILDGGTPIRELL
jgi:hypothetical protein